jgi:SET domain-containing protein
MGSFVCLYEGEKITLEQYEGRIQVKPSRNCYCFLVERPCRRDSFVIDASDFPYLQTFGRTINHDKDDVNIIPRIRVMKSGEYKGREFVYFAALRDIEKGEELAYHYGDKRKNTDLDQWD